MQSSGIEVSNAVDFLVTYGMRMAMGDEIRLFGDQRAKSGRMMAMRESQPFVPGQGQHSRWMVDLKIDGSCVCRQIPFIITVSEDHSGGKPGQLIKNQMAFHVAQMDQQL